MAPPTTLFPVQEREVWIVKEAVPGVTSWAFTATSASPCVFTATGSALVPGTAVSLAGGSLPAPFAAGVLYYVVVPSANTFQLAATPGGAAINSTSSGSGTVTAAGFPVPVTTCKPSDKPMMIEDTSEQGHMGDISGIYQGPLIAAVDLAGHFTGDVFGHLLYNLLGDYTTTGTAASPNGTTNAAMAAGATAIPVASGGASFTTGMAVWIEDAGSPTANEVVYVNGTSTATSIPVTATRFTHASGTPITNTTAPYTHAFAMLNGLTGAWNGAAQPPSHAVTDRTGIPAAGLAAQYGYSCVSDITLTGNSEKLLDWTAKVVCQTRQIAPSPIGTVNVSGVQPYPSWRSVVGVGGVASGGTQAKNNAEWMFTITRAVKAYNTNQGAQTPYVIGRGKLGVTGKLVFLPAIDESAVIALLANTQPQLEVIASNGLAGANLVSVTADIGLGAYTTADLNEGSELFGYDVPIKAVHTGQSFTCTPFTGPLAGASGGKSAIKITLVNAVPTY